jgi:uncharacterized membrane protein YjjP (DUF1212 family)
VIASANADDQIAAETLETILRFGSAMLESGTTAYRAHRAMTLLAGKCGCAAPAFAISHDSIAGALKFGAGRGSLIQGVGAGSVNAERLTMLDKFAAEAPARLTASTVAARLQDVNGQPPRYRPILVIVSVGLASGAFALLNSAGLVEAAQASVGAGLGQALRVHLGRRRVSPYSIAALCALLAAGSYAILALITSRLGAENSRDAAGVVSSVLFLVPGFPLLTALLDLLEQQTSAATGRLVYGMTYFISAAIGLSVVTAAFDLDLSRPTPTDLGTMAVLVIRGAATFVGASGFAVLFGSAPHAVLATGLISAAANLVRLGLYDAGVALAPASFVAAFLIGLAASALRTRWGQARIVMTVPCLIVMIPGLYAFQFMVLFNHGRLTNALEAAASGTFVIGAMVIGLVTARSVAPDRSQN